jgi:moderate conductance mechanosensitive channel
MWRIRNGRTARIGNQSQGWSRALTDNPLGYNESLDMAPPLIRVVVPELCGAQDLGNAAASGTVLAGIESMTGALATVRIIAPCTPNGSCPLSQEMRDRVKTAFDAAGIRAPQVLPSYDGGLSGVRAWA